MDKKLHNDGLDDFLKKSFDRYEEAPSDSVWEGVQAGLASGSSTTVAVFMSKWWIGALVAVVSGLFIGQYFYFQNRIDQLSEEVEIKSIELEDTVAELNNVLENQRDIETIDSKTKPELTTGFIDNVTVEYKNRENNLVGQTQKNDSGENFSVSKMKPSEIEQTAFDGLENRLVDQGLQKEESVTIVNLSFPNKIELNKLAKFPIPEAVIPSVNPRNNSIIPNPKSKGGLYLGTQLGVFSSTEKIRRIDKKSSHNSGSSGGGNQKCDFDETGSGNGVTQNYGIVFGYQGDKKWGFESGINYRTTTINNLHTARFDFDKIKDKVQNVPNSMSNQRKLDYHLNTSSGVVDLELMIEDTNPDNNPPKHEKIDFRIETATIQKHLSIPLLATYKIGQGRLNMKIKSGVLANILLSDEFIVEKASSSHSKFRFNQPNDSKGSLQSLVPVSFDFLVSVGAEYDLDDKLSFVFEPTLMGAISPIHIDHFIHSSKFSVGVNASLMYNF
ncbi:MAG: hypothetical protein NXI23_06640 [Bacteroidetes bacterium]|jgi:hypothetical protein|nr:hypothetical protein [Bacteroidota bacterium]